MKQTLRDFLCPQPKSKIKAGDGQLKGAYNFYTSSQIQSKFYHSATYTQPALIFGTGGMASVHYCNEPFSTSTDCLVMYGRLGAPLELIYYYLRSNMHLLQDGFKGAGLQHISKDYILNININMPAPSLQEQITHQMRLIDAMINGKKQQILSFDEAVKSRFIELFGEPELNPRDLPVLPWGAVFQTTTGKLDSNAMVENGRYPFFTCAKESYKIDSYAFDCEALLLAGNNAAGIYDVKHYKGKFNAYQRTYVLRLMNEKWSYILFKRQLEDKLRYLQSQSKGTNTRYLTLGILNELRFVVPPIAEQEQFATFVEQTDKSKLFDEMEVAA